MRPVVGRREGIVGRKNGLTVAAREVDRPAITCRDVAERIPDSHRGGSAVPASTLAGSPESVRVAASAWLTVMPDCEPVTDEVAVSVAVRDCTPRS